MDSGIDSIQNASPNEVMRTRLENIGDALAPFYSRAHSCSSVEELNSILEDLNTISSDFESVFSEVSEFLRETVDDCRGASSLNEKKTLLRDGILRTKEWVYEHKQLFGYSTANEEEFIVVGKFSFRAGVYAYDKKPLNLPPRLARLLNEFLSSPNHKLQRGRIASLGDVAKHRVSDLRKILRRAGAKPSVISYDGYLEEYTLHVD